MLLENVQKLTEAAEKKSTTTAAESLVELPESLGALFSNYNQHKPLPSLKGPIHPGDVGNKVSVLE